MKQEAIQFDTVNINEQNDALLIIDQTQLPGKKEILSLNKLEDIWDAIYLLKVRGAPAIGVAAAIGIYLAAKKLRQIIIQNFCLSSKKRKNIWLAHGQLQ